MLILFTTEVGKSQIQLRAEHPTVWLTHREMAELFDATKQNISLDVKNLCENRQLHDASVVKGSLTTEGCSSGAATVKQSLTVASRNRTQSTAEESSVVGSAHLPARGLPT